MPHKAVGIVVAMRRELASLLRGGKAISIDGVDVFELDSAVVAVGGIGKDAAQKAATVLAKTYKPDVMVSAGIAGALTENLRVGDVIHAGEVVDAATGQRFVADARLTAGQVNRQFFASVRQVDVGRDRLIRHGANRREPSGDNPSRNHSQLPRKAATDGALLSLRSAWDQYQQSDERNNSQSDNDHRSCRSLCVSHAWSSRGVGFGAPFAGPQPH